MCASNSRPALQAAAEVTRSCRINSKFAAPEAAGENVLSLPVPRADSPSLMRSRRPSPVELLLELELLELLELMEPLELLLELELLELIEPLELLLELELLEPELLLELLLGVSAKPGSPMESVPAPPLPQAINDTASRPVNNNRQCINTNLILIARFI